MSIFFIFSMACMTRCDLSRSGSPSSSSRISRQVVYEAERVILA